MKDDLQFWGWSLCSACAMLTIMHCTASHNSNEKQDKELSATLIKEDTS